MLIKVDDKHYVSPEHVVRVVSEHFSVIIELSNGRSVAIPYCDEAEALEIMEILVKKLNKGLEQQQSVPTISIEMANTGDLQ